MGIENNYWLSNKRFIIIAILLMIIFFTLMGLIYSKGNELSKHPCTLCAESHSATIQCFLPGIRPIRESYDPNGTITKGYI